MRHGRRELCNISTKKSEIRVDYTRLTERQNVIKRKKWLIWTDGQTGGIQGSESQRKPGQRWEIAQKG